MLKIKAINHIQALFSHLIGTLLMLVTLYFLEFNADALIVFGTIWLIYTVPVVYLHLEYFSRNKDEEYEIRDNEIVYRKLGEEILYKSQDIEKIIIYLSPSLYKNSNFHLLAIESYHFAEVRLKTGKKLVLTCLLAPRIDKELKQIKGVLIEKRKKIFCMI